MKRLAIFGFVLSALVCGFLYAGSFWKEKPFTDWKMKEIQKMLVNSPWATDQTFGREPDAGASTPWSSEVDMTGSVPQSPSNTGEHQTGDSPISKHYFLRFQSALPIRMALAQEALLDGRTTREKAYEYVENHPAPGQIVLVLSVSFGQDKSELERGSTDLLRSCTFLILKESKKKIHLAKYLSPSETGGTEAYLYFPRTENGKELITLDEKEVRFICELGPQTRLNRNFKLKKMVFKGELEI